jgi:hypothetical protein
MKNDSVLLRLRAANPYPAITTSDGGELFDSITALPRHTRDARRRSRRPVLVLAVALLTVAVLASTAFAISEWLGGDVVKPHVTLAEYRAAQRELTLPPGSSWPALNVDPNSVTTRGGGGGYAVLNAEIAWDCFWVSAIRHGDVAAQTRAHAQLDKLIRNNMLVAPAGAPEGWIPPNPPARPFAVFAHDGGYEWLQQTVALAAAGQPQRLAQRCVANR